LTFLLDSTLSLVTFFGIKLGEYMSSDRPPIAESEQAHRPWGYFTTCVWFVLPIVTFSTLFVVAMAHLNPDPKEVAKHSTVWLKTYGTTFVGGAQVAVLVLAARLRRWEVTRYFALVRPSKHQIAITLASLIVLLAAEAAVNYIMDSDTGYTTGIYASARSAACCN
jgi:hypothetical protein